MKGLPKISEMVGQERRVEFIRYRDGELWYRACNGFEFPVPIDDAAGADFLASDAAMLYMRWIRKHLELLALKKSEIEQKRAEWEKSQNDFDKRAEWEKSQNDFDKELP